MTRKTGGVASRAKPGSATAEDLIVAGVRITHPNRVVYPDQGVTKGALARYYAAMAEHILPHVVGRPAVLVRCPDGLGQACFYQKHAGPWAPASLRRVRIAEKTKTGEYLVIEDVAGLIGLIQMGVLEIHTWNAQARQLEAPDRLVFDLDPGPDVSWRAVVVAAQLVRSTLDASGLRSFVKTTGGKGLHVVVPIDAGPSWPECLAFTERVAETLVAAAPRALTATMAKAARQGKIFIDYLRNQRGATSVAAFSTRARPGAPVSVPIAWDELGSLRSADQFTIQNISRRLGRLAADPWAEYASLRQTLPASGGTGDGSATGQSGAGDRRRPARRTGAGTPARKR
jgi:bifunctional non-homologous end joining protein LigD